MRILPYSALLSSLCLLLGPATTRAQWVPQTAGTLASFRGLRTVSDDVAWASGSQGTFLWTNNGGAEWHSGIVPGASTLSFRSVHPVSLDTAYLVSAGEDTGRIYYTTDRGQHWITQYDKVAKGLFFDAVAFFDRTHALVFGDPIDGHFTLLRTNDAGAHWTFLAPDATPDALPNETAFAASGSALVTKGSRHAWFATGGGRVARVFRTTDGGATWQVSETPVKAGNAASGIFSLAFIDTLHGVAVGGNYSAPDSTVVAAAYTDDGGVTWTAVPPSKATAYLSSVAYVPNTNGKSLVAVGSTGTSFSLDAGRTWRVLNARPFNVVAAASHGRILAAGEGGAIATLRALEPDPAPAQSR